jgi:hypothetical protein
VTRTFLYGGSVPPRRNPDARRNFRCTSKVEQFNEYLILVKFLEPEPEKIDGFIDNERVGSQRAECRVLSLSTWRDKKAIIRWRTLGVHHEV